jgi:thiol-disulfide isomerase/thioredoxin
MQLFKRFVLITMIFTAVYSDEQRDIMLPNLSVKLLDGKQVRLSALLEEGPLLVDFWATWCAPCKKEMIFLEEFHQKYNEYGFRVLAISTDSPKSMSKVKSYIRAKKYTFMVGLDPNQEIAKK